MYNTPAYLSCGSGGTGTSKGNGIPFTHTSVAMFFLSIFCMTSYFKSAFLLF